MTRYENASMFGSLANRVAVITGAASGIGRACAEAFFAEGSKIVVADMNGREAARVARQFGEGAISCELDVRDESACTSLAQLAVDRFGTIDAVVTAAAISTSQPAPLLDTSVAHWRELQEVNALGTFLVIRACLFHLTTGGSVVTVASGAGRRAEPGIGAYCVSKASVWMLTKVLALELGGRGIRVNCIGPGLIQTPMTAAFLAQPGARDSIEAMTPLGRIGLPGEVADVAVFLAGERARFVTGMFLAADGGKDAAQR